MGCDRSISPESRISVRVYLLTDPKALRGDAETNFNIFHRMKGDVISVPSSKIT